MKNFFSILLLLSVIAFAGVSANEKPEKSDPMETILICGHCDIGAATAIATLCNKQGIEVVTVVTSPEITDAGFILNQVESLQIQIQKMKAEVLLIDDQPNEKNPIVGLKKYSWQHDKRSDIRQHCRSNC